MPTGIPTDTEFTTVNTVTHMDLSTSGAVNAAIDTGATTAIGNQMVDQGWSQDPLYASTTMTLVPLVNTNVITNFALWIADFMERAYEVYNITLGQRDPTGDFTGGVQVIGLGVNSQTGLQTDSQYQTYLIDTLIFAMNHNQFPGKIWDVVGINVGGALNTYQNLRITADIFHPGPLYNDWPMSANVFGAGLINGLPKGGGWTFTSVPTPGNGSTMTVSLTNSYISNLVVAWNFNVSPGEAFLHSPHIYYLAQKADYFSVVMPHQWLLFNANDGLPYTPHAADELAFGGDNLWICNPRVPDAQLLDPITPITYCGFSVTKNRGLPYESFNCSTCINATFFEGPMDAFEVDVGFSFLALNAMHHAAGELATTAGKSITISSLIALSSSFDGPLQIVGDVWGMYVTTQYVALDKLSMTTDNAHQMIAYRSQDAPCSMTVFLAIS